MPSQIHRGTMWRCFDCGHYRWAAEGMAPAMHRSEDVPVHTSVPTVQDGKHTFRTVRIAGWTCPNEVPR